MKKIMLPLLLFFCIALNTSAASWKFMWDETTTTIEIPLGGNLQNYISIPKAMLYKDGMPLQDADISYSSTGDWLYLLTDVDTQKKGSYQVWYKAVENKYKPGQCQGYKALITFNVVDKEPPIFEAYPKEIIHWISGDKPDYLTQIIAVDNSGDCKVSIDDSLVNYEIPGEYEAMARASDGSFIVEQPIRVIVKDPIGPLIKFLGENNRIRLIKGEPFKLQSYFKAIDTIDGDVTSSISYSPFDSNIEQSFELEVSFSDKNGNVSRMNVWIDIVDEDEIHLELYQSCLVLDYKKDFKAAIQENIKNATLGKENIKDLVEIDYGNLKNEVGSYKVIYSYQKKDKRVSETCEVKLLSSQAPVLLVENVSTLVNEKVSLADHILAKDLSDSDITSKIEYDDSLVDWTKEGCYPVQVTVTNSSNLSSCEILYVTVYSNSSSAIEEAQSSFFIPILVGGAIIIAGMIGFIYIKKKRNCNKEENQL